MHIVSGGGGAYLRPFADLQKNEKRSAPKDVFHALITYGTLYKTYVGKGLLRNRDKNYICSDKY